MCVCLNTLLRTHHVQNSTYTQRERERYTNRNDLAVNTMKNWIKNQKKNIFISNNSKRSIYYTGALDGFMLLMTLLLASKSNLLFCIKCGIEKYCDNVSGLSLICHRLQTKTMMTVAGVAKKAHVQFDRATNELPGLKSHFIINLCLPFFTPPNSQLR